MLSCLSCWISKINWNSKVHILFVQIYVSSYNFKILWTIFASERLYKLRSQYFLLVFLNTCIPFFNRLKNFISQIALDVYFTPRVANAADDSRLKYGINETGRSSLLKQENYFRQVFNQNQGISFAFSWETKRKIYSEKFTVLYSLQL